MTSERDYPLTNYDGDIMQNLIPDNEEALLTRDATAAALTASGFPVKPKTLATKATRGGGPPFMAFGKRVLYRWGSTLKWAKEQLSAPRC